MKYRFKQLYMDIAVRISSMSQAQRLKVGCILVKDDRIISMSWNGTPNGWDNDCETKVIVNGAVELVTKPEVIHAESNCISKLARSTESGIDSIMFITHNPCLECSKLIYQAGIKEVYYLNDYRCNAGIKFLKKCNVHIEKLS